MKRPTLGIYKFTSCDGCQLAFLNAGELLLQLAQQVDIVHFAEAGPVHLNQSVDIAFVEGSISTPDEIERIHKIRAQSRFLITIGACATAGGIQALRNFANHAEWMQSVYAAPDTIASLATSMPISSHVKVDCELWGCPVSTHQVMDAIASLLHGVMPRIKQDAVCLECKRKNYVCVMVAQNQPCMGPVTQTGCGALCPGIERACYACYGPKEKNNTQALSHWFMKYGMTEEQLARKFLHINNQADTFKQTGSYFKGIPIVKES